jgi:hypothetical protein
MKTLLVTCFAVLLSACTTINNPLTPGRLATIESTYGAALSVAVGYRNACARKAIPPSCRPIVVQLQNAGRVAQTRVLALRQFVQQNPTLDATNLISAAQSAVQAFQDVQTVYGVQ